MEILKRDSNSINIASFWEGFSLGKFNFDPPYQRDSVWDEEKQSFFIDSILRNYPIPPIFLHQKLMMTPEESRLKLLTENRGSLPLLILSMAK